MGGVVARLGGGVTGDGEGKGASRRGTFLGVGEGRECWEWGS